MGVVVATIRSESKELDPTIELLGLEIHHELNRIPEAKLTLLDGSWPKREFELSNTPFFEPGKSIAIALRYEGEGADETLFEGLVVRHAVEAEAERSVLRVELKDAAFKLTRQRRSAVFREQGDDEAIRKLIGDAGLTVGELAATKPKHVELIQYYASDWDFIVSRADVQGLAVKVMQGKISVQPLVPSGAARAKFEYGIADVRELELELDAGAQWSGMRSVAWNIADQKLGAPSEASDPEAQVGNLDAAAVAHKLGGDGYTLLHPTALDPDELQAWADARLARSRLALLRGRLVSNGRADIAPGDAIELAGVSERFNGKALVSAVIHRVDHDGWQTELRLGLAPEWFARQPDIADVPAAGLLPPVQGLQIATVSDFEKDPDGEHRIKLALPALDDTQGSVWARFTQTDAGEQRGQVFWPEPEDEVVVGFLGSDPRQAVVLGSLYSKARPPPDAGGPPSNTNSRRAIVSKAGTLIAFDDDKATVEVATPGGNSIVIDDEQQSISLKDQHGSTIVMDQQGITLTSAKDLQIDASGNVVIKGSAVDIQ